MASRRRMSTSWLFLSHKEVARQISDADVVMDDYTFRIEIDALIREKMKKIEIYRTAEHRLRPHRCGGLREEGHPRGEHRWG
jgi:hypothetical protein